MAVGSSNLSVFGSFHETVRFGFLFLLFLIWLIIGWYVSSKAKALPDQSNQSPEHAAALGKYQRAVASQRNTLEAFAFYYIAILLNSISEGNAQAADILCLLFIICRIFYPIFYAWNMPFLRSIFWGLGMLAIIALMINAFSNHWSYIFFPSTSVIKANSIKERFRRPIS